MLAIIVGAAIIVGVAVSFYLIRDVSNGIASIVKPMQALGRGDLSVETPTRERRRRWARWPMPSRSSRKR